MSQSKKNSLLESIVNTFVGMVITFAVSPVIYWVCNIEVTAGKMGAATILFTVVSVIRNYFIRRWFNKPKSEGKSKSIKLIFKIPDLPSQSPTEIRISYLELCEDHLKYRLDFDSLEWKDPEDHMLGSKEVQNDFYLFVLKKYVVGCERLLTDSGLWKVVIIANGVPQDPIVYFPENQAQESLEFCEIINNWLIKKS